MSKPKKQLNHERLTGLVRGNFMEVQGFGLGFRPFGPIPNRKGDGPEFAELFFK